MDLQDFRAHVLAQREAQAKTNAQTMREIANAKKESN